MAPIRVHQPVGTPHEPSAQAIRFLRLLLSFLILVPAAPRAAAPPAPSERAWQPGEVLDSDIVAPVPLTISNPILTQADLTAGIQKVPPVFRHDASKVGTAVATMRAEYEAARRQFVTLLEAGFRQPTLRTVGDLTDPRFLEACTVFRSRNPVFPLSTNVAELWALGDDGKVVLEDLSAQLRRFMAVYLRPDSLPGGESLAAPFVRILPTANGRSSDAGAGPQAGVLVLRDNVFAVSRYQRELIELAPDGDKATVRFLAGFLQANCTFDEPLTRTAREQQVAEMTAVARYEAGSILARRGETIDARVKQLLDALRALPSSPARIGPAAAAVSHSGTGSGIRHWLAAIAAAGALAAGGFWFWRRRSSRPRAVASWAVVEADAPASGVDAEAWRKRALAAEARAEKATAMLRTNLLPHLARWMMSELLQRLLSQRSVAQSSAQQAETEVAELAERLEKLHAPMEERRRAYETRIAELEAELAARDEQDRELIQARIESTRRRLESDRPDRPNDGSWN